MMMIATVTSIIVEAAATTKEKGPKRIGPFAVPKAMSSGPSAVLSTWFKIRGINYSISSACATSAHCIGAGAEQIQMGKQDIIFAGGCEELDWTLSNLFDAMGAMSSNFNDRPAVASRAYDKDRDGFVIAGGAGVVVLEEYEHAKARGAKIYGELVGYAANSDGYDMVAPSGEGAARCMRLAMAEAGNRGAFEAGGELLGLTAAAFDRGEEIGIMTLGHGEGAGVHTRRSAEHRRVGEVPRSAFRQSGDAGVGGGRLGQATQKVNAAQGQTRDGSDQYGADQPARVRARLRLDIQNSCPARRGRTAPRQKRPQETRETTVGQS